MVLKKVFALESPDDLTKDLVWTYKAYQERAQFTDIALICKNGDKVQAHGAVVMKHCPQLRMIAAKFACCYCHGTECGGCAKNGNLMSLSLPDFTKETVTAFLELLYTGRTYFTSNNDYEKVVDLGKHLGFAIPASGLSFAQGDFEESRTVRNKRKSMDTSTPLRKKSRTESVDTAATNAPPTATESPLSLYKCQICQRTFNSKYLLKKHGKDCFDLSQNNEHNNESIPAASAAEEDASGGGGKKKCDNCGESFAIQGGWLTKHLRSCLNESTIAEIIQESTAEDSESGSKKECQVCHKSFATSGGWYTKHVAKCQKCHKCGKNYAPHVARHLDQHVAKCNGIASNPDSPAAIADSSLKEESSLSSQPDETAVLDLTDFESLYQQGKWSCFRCSKWFGRRDVLRQHLLVHYKKEIQAEFLEDPTNTTCSLCDHQAPTVKSLLHHISLASHMKLKDFVPGFVAEYLFDKEVKPAMTESPKLKCSVCDTGFEEKTSFTDHIVEHFSEQINDRFIENGNKCGICQYIDANLGQLTKHVALQHEKIREYLPSQDGEALFEVINHVDEPEQQASSSVDKPAKKVQEFDCYICHKSHKNRPDLRQHIFCHLRQEIQAKFYPGIDQVKNCIECPYKSTIGEHVVMHLALKHKKLSEFVPPEVGKTLFMKGNASMSKKKKAGKASSSPKEKQARPIACVRCKSSLPNKDEMRVHLETCTWNCPSCDLKLRDPKSIKTHRSRCGENASLDSTSYSAEDFMNAGPDKSGFNCFICQRYCRHFHYLKGHLSMHYREDLRNKMSEWGGGQGGSGFACQLCDFTTSTKDALTTHAGYKHSLFVDFMPSHMKSIFLEIAKTVGENTEETAADKTIEDPDADEFKCPKCKLNFDTQLLLASHMTNTNCLPINNKVVRCLLCDFEVGSALQYKCHLLVHYHPNVEAEVKETFKEVEGICKDCDPNGKPMDFADFTRHLALDHDKIISVVSSEVRSHLSLSFPGSDAIIRSDDDEQPNKENKETSFPEEIHIEIEPVDDKDDEDDMDTSQSEQSNDLKTSA